MGEIVKAIQDTPIPSMFILVGLFIIVLAFVNRIGGIIEVSPEQKRLAIPIGLFILTVGLVLYFVSPSGSPITNNGNTVTTTSSPSSSELYRLQTAFTGNNKCLSVLPNGSDNQLIMANCSDENGQLWEIQPINNANYYRLKSKLLEGQCLDILNNENDNQIIIQGCNGGSGQSWSIQPTNNPGFYQLKTAFTGENKCLDIVNDKNDNQISMSDCGAFSGQLWKPF